MIDGDRKDDTLLTRVSNQATPGQWMEDAKKVRKPRCSMHAT